MSRMLVQLMVALLGVATLIHAYPAEPEISFSTTTARPLNPDHVPRNTCVSMSPVHGDSVAQDNSNVPYRVSVSSQRVTPGSTIQVTMSGIGEEEFKGTYIQGRLQPDDVPVGEFAQSTNPNVRISDCDPGEKNAASYISRQSINQVVLDWTAPNTLGDIIFKCTFVQSFSKFWVKVESPIVKIVAE